MYSIVNRSSRKLCTFTSRLYTSTCVGLQKHVYVSQSQFTRSNHLQIGLKRIFSMINMRSLFSSDAKSAPSGDSLHQLNAVCDELVSSISREEYQHDGEGLRGLEESGFSVEQIDGDEEICLKKLVGPFGVEIVFHPLAQDVSEDMEDEGNESEWTESESDSDSDTDSSSSGEDHEVLYEHAKAFRVSITHASIVASAQGDAHRTEAPCINLACVASNTGELEVKMVEFAEGEESHITEDAYSMPEAWDSFLQQLGINDKLCFNIQELCEEKMLEQRSKVLSGIAKLIQAR